MRAEREQLRETAGLWRLNLFGGFAVERPDGKFAKFETRKTAELAAFLATFPDREHTREYLCELLWPEVDPKLARHRLSQALSALRKELGLSDGGEVLFGDTNALQLSSELVQTDVREFERLLAKASLGEAPLEHLQSAVALVRGEFLAAFDSEWIYEERSRLYARHVDALAMLRAEHESAGDLAQALAYAVRLTELEPLDEDHAFEAIRLYATSGQPKAAIRHFRMLEKRLLEDLNETPSAATRTLVQQIQQRHETQLQSVAAIPISIKSPTREAISTVPRQFTTFFGRSTELDGLVAELIAGGSFVTVTGVAGCGKTRLAIEAGHRFHQDSHHSVWFVSLAEARNESEFLTALLHSLRPHRLDAGSVFEQIVAHLRGLDRALLIVDNFDHLAEDCPVLRQLATEAPHIQFLVTTRQRLNIEGEREFPLMPLDVPPLGASEDVLIESPSVKLFIDRAQSARQDFLIPATQYATLRTLCERLEGIPLAIELAASWAHALTLEQMLSEVNRRFDLLVSRRRDIPKRHRTLRAAIEYSYQLLSPELQRFLTQLAVFEGGWTLEAARTVCQAPDSLEMLGQLLDRSLLFTEERPADFEGARYRMLDTIREFSWEKMPGDMRAELTVRHADYYCGLALKAESKMTGHEQTRWLTLVDAEHRNFLAALRWCLQHSQAESGLALASGLAQFWLIRGPRTEGIQWLTEFLNAPASEIPPVARAKALAALGYLHWSQSDFDQSEEAHRACMEIQQQLGDRLGQSHSFYYLGIISVRRAQYELARQQMEQSLVLASEVGDASAMAKALLNLGNIAKYANDYASAKSYYERSLELEQSVGNLERVATALNNLGSLAISEGKFVLAEFYLQECARVYETLQNRGGVAIALMNLGKLSERQGQVERATGLLCDALLEHREAGNRFFMRECFVELAKVQVRRRQFQKAALLLASADAITKEISAPMPPEDAAVYEAVRAHVAAELDGELIEAALASARRLRFDELLQLASV